MPSPSPSQPPQQIAVLGGAGRSGGRLALIGALAPRLLQSRFVLQAIDDPAQLHSPALVLLLAPAGDDDDGDEEEDLRWRERLAQSGTAFSVLHGDAQARLDGAWRLIAPLLGLAPSTEDDRAAGQAPGRWSWSCDKCSDPACEHRLFQDLLQGRRQDG